MARFLVIGATGFIGRHVVAALLDRRHTVVGLHRGKTPPSLASQRQFVSHRAQLAALKAPEDWRGLLDGVDAVVHCADLIGTSEVLIKTCETLGLTRFVYISSTALKEEDTLQSSGLDWVVLRPNLIYTRGWFGGTPGGTTQMLRLAAGRGAALLPGGGTQSYRPMCMEDLVGIICELAEASSFNHRVIEPVGPDSLTLREIILKLRYWLDISGEKTLSVPTWLVRSPVPATIQQIGEDAPQSFRGLYAPAARSMDEVLASQPATAQDRQSARRSGLWTGLVLVTVIAGLALAVLALTAPQGAGL